MDLLFVLGYFGLLLSIAFVYGGSLLVLLSKFRLFIKKQQGSAPADRSIGVSLSILIALGLAYFIIISAILGAINLSATAIYVVTFVHLAILLTGLREYRLLQTIRRNMHQIPLLIFALITFAWFIHISLWPAPGDLITHTAISAGIADLGSYTDPKAFLNSIGAEVRVDRIPEIGLYVITAAFSTITGVNVIYSSFLIVGLIVSIIPLIVYDISFRFTSRVSYSLLAAVATFFLPGGKFSTLPAHNLLSSDFINGAYPNQIGIMLLLLSIYFILFRKDPISRLALPIVFLSIGITYSAMIAWVPFLLTIVVLSQDLPKLFKAPRQFALRNADFIAVILITLIIIVALNTLFISTLNAVKGSAIRSTLFKINTDSSVLIPYLQWPYLLIIAGAVTASILLAKDREHRPLSIMLIFMGAIFLLCMNKQIYDNVLWFVFPHRSFIVFIALSYVVLSLAVAQLVRWLSRENTIQKIFGRIYAHSSSRYISLILIVLIFVPVFQVYYDPTKNPSWGRPSDNDIQAMDWIKNNISKKEIILNDITFAGLYLPAYSTRPVVNFYSVSTDIPEVGKRIYEFNNFFNAPQDYEYLKTLSSKYHVNYIFITSQNLVIKYSFDAIEGGYKYRHDGYTQRNNAIFLKQLDENPALKLEFKSGGARVYKILS